jgi:hypothetical protein
MGQLLLPIFPSDTRMITLKLGVREYDGTVYYLHSGVPIFSHLSDDLIQESYQQYVVELLTFIRFL